MKFAWVPILLIILGLDIAVGLVVYRIGFENGIEHHRLVKYRPSSEVDFKKILGE